MGPADLVCTEAAALTRTHAMVLGVAKPHETGGMGTQKLALLRPAAKPLWRQAAQQAGKYQQPHAGHPYCLQAKPDAFDDKQRSEMDFFEYVARSYHFFLAGDDYQSQAVDDEKAQELEERAGEVKLRNQASQQVGADTAASVVLKWKEVWQGVRPLGLRLAWGRGAGESNLHDHSMQQVWLLPALHGRSVLL